MTPEIFKNADLDDCYNEKLKEFLKSWAKKRPYSLYFCGTYGCGKTWTAHAVIKEIYKHTGHPYFYHFIYETPNMARILREAILNGTESHLIDKWSEAPLLVIDDLGREKATDRVLEQFYVVINERYKRQLPTIVTSNYKPEQLNQDEATISRMQSWNIINFPNKDERIKNDYYSKH